MAPQDYPERRQQVERLYQAALEQEPGHRSAYVQEACGGDEALRGEVEELLARAAEAPAFAALLTRDLAFAPLLAPDSSREATDLLAAGSQQPASVYRLAVNRRLGPYEILKPLGAGGMGEIYSARDTRLGRTVAVKVLAAHLLDQSGIRRRFEMEARAISSLNHPNVCTLHDIGRDTDIDYLVMEYLEGQTLAQRLRQGPLPYPDLLRIAIEISEALDYAHSRGVIHRDLKPGNIMLTARGAKLLDFGLASWRQQAIELSMAAAPASLAGSLTVTGALLGTLQYMAPEQVDRQDVDARTDIFALGAVIFEMAARRKAFQGKNQNEIIGAILTADPPDPSTLESEVPVVLDPMVRKCLRKLPGERWQSAGEVARELKRLEQKARLATAYKDTPLQIPLIGRDQEQAELSRLLDAAIAGHGSLVLIGGEPGIGKTHLTRAIVAEAASRGCLTVAGHCSEMEGAPPYVPFIEMLEYAARTVSREGFRNAIGDAAPEVAKLMPELRRMYPDIPPPIELPPEQQRRFLFNAYREFVERSARARPMVAVFEDLHWADEPTLLLLQHLAQTAGTVPMMMIGTYRDVELDVTQPFARTLESLLRAKLASRMSLQRLPVDGVEALLAALSGHTPPRALARVLFEGTEGNPYFVEEVFRHLAEEGRLFDEKGAWRPGLRADDLRVPEGVRLVIGRRLERLGDETRRELAKAAVLGRTFSLRLLGDLDGAGADAALEAIEEAEAAHLVVAERAGREPRYRFVHELIRQTLAETLSLPRRQRLHARAADAIERIYAANLDSQTSALAHHLHQAGAAADAEKTVAWLTRAARQASAATAYEDALAHSDNALSLLEGEQSTRVAELHAERATILRSLGRTPDAIASYERALGVFSAISDVARFAETSVPLVWTHIWGLRLSEARNVADRALVRLGAEDSPLRVALLSGLAIAAACSGEIDTAVSLLDQLQQTQVSPHHPVMVGMAWGLQANVRWHAGQLDLADKAGRQAQKVFETWGDLWGQVEVTWVLLLTAILSGRLEEAESIVRQTGPVADRVGHRAFLWCSKFVLVARRMVGGDLEGADRVLRELVEYGREFQIGWNFIGETEVGSIARLRGHATEAGEWFRLAMGAPLQNSYSAYAPASLALTLAQVGDPGALLCLREAQQFLPRPGRRPTVGSWLAVAYVVEGLVLIGRSDEAAALHHAAEGLIDTGFTFTYTSVLPYTAAGIAAACAGEWTAAARHHQAAIQLADTLHHRVAQAISRYWYGEMVVARANPGDVASGRALISEALALFESQGMPLYARRASARLASLR